MTRLFIIVFLIFSCLLQDQVCRSFLFRSDVLIRRLQSLKMVVSTTGSGKRVRPQGYDREKGIANPNLLRITGGKARGLKLDSPNVYLRPMMAKVREALFNCLGHYELFEANTTRVLDLFSGSGSVGIEALSRGAAHTTFVDLADDCVSTALSNAHKCGFGGQVSAVKGDVLDVLISPEKYKLTEKYQLISLTPPYEEVVYNHLLDALCASPLISENTFVVLEYPVELGTLPFVWGDYKLFGLRNRRYGRTILCVYVYKPTDEFDLRQEEFTLDAVRRKKG